MRVRSGLIVCVVVWCMAFLSFWSSELSWVISSIEKPIGFLDTERALLEKLFERLPEVRDGEPRRLDTASEKALEGFFLVKIEVASLS